MEGHICCSCNKPCYSEEGAWVRLDCWACGESCMHEDCLANYTRKATCRRAKEATHGYSCPHGRCGKSLGQRECPGKVKGTHIVPQAHNSSRKGKEKRMAARAPPPAAGNHAPAAAAPAAPAPPQQPPPTTPPPAVTITIKNRAVEKQPSPPPTPQEPALTQTADHESCSTSAGQDEAPAAQQSSRQGGQPGQSNVDQSPSEGSCNTQAGSSLLPSSAPGPGAAQLEVEPMGPSKHEAGRSRNAAGGVEAPQRTAGHTAVTGKRVRGSSQVVQSGDSNRQQGRGKPDPSSSVSATTPPLADGRVGCDEASMLLSSRSSASTSTGGCSVAPTSEGQGHLSSTASCPLANAGHRQQQQQQQQGAQSSIASISAPASSGTRGASFSRALSKEPPGPGKGNKARGRSNSERAPAQTATAAAPPAAAVNQKGGRNKRDGFISGHQPATSSHHNNNGHHQGAAIDGSRGDSASDIRLPYNAAAAAGGLSREGPSDSGAAEGRSLSWGHHTSSQSVTPHSLEGVTWTSSEWEPQIKPHAPGTATQARPVHSSAAALPTSPAFAAAMTAAATTYQGGTSSGHPEPSTTGAALSPPRGFTPWDYSHDAEIAWPPPEDPHGPGAFRSLSGAFATAGGAGGGCTLTSTLSTNSDAQHADALAQKPSSGGHAACEPPSCMPHMLTPDQGPRRLPGLPALVDHIIQPSGGDTNSLAAGPHSFGTSGTSLPALFSHSSQPLTSSSSHLRSLPTSASTFTALGAADAGMGLVSPPLAGARSGGLFKVTASEAPVASGAVIPLLGQPSCGASAAHVTGFGGTQMLVGSAAAPPPAVLAGQASVDAQMAPAAAATAAAFITSPAPGIGSAAPVRQASIAENGSLMGYGNGLRNATPPAAAAQLPAFPSGFLSDTAGLGSPPPSAAQLHPTSSQQLMSPSSAGRGGGGVSGSSGIGPMEFMLSGMQRMSITPPQHSAGNTHHNSHLHQQHHILNTHRGPQTDTRFGPGSENLGAAGYGKHPHHHQHRTNSSNPMPNPMPMASPRSQLGPHHSTPPHHHHLSHNHNHSSMLHNGHSSTLTSPRYHAHTGVPNAAPGVLSPKHVPGNHHGASATHATHSGAHHSPSSHHQHHHHVQLQLSNQHQLLHQQRQHQGSSANHLHSAQRQMQLSSSTSPFGQRPGFNNSNVHSTVQHSPDQFGMALKLLENFSAFNTAGSTGPCADAESEDVEPSQRSSTADMAGGTFVTPLAMQTALAAAAAWS